MLNIPSGIIGSGGAYPKYKISKIEMPESVMAWGIVQISPFINTNFRFSMVEGKPILDTSYLADQGEDPNKKNEKLSPESEVYKYVQKLLDEYALIK